MASLVVGAGIAELPDAPKGYPQEGSLYHSRRGMDSHLDTRLVAQYSDLRWSGAALQDAATPSRGTYPAWQFPTSQLQRVGQNTHTAHPAQPRDQGVALQVQSRERRPWDR
jgi:hypothetical protein